MPAKTTVRFLVLPLAAVLVGVGVAILGAGSLAGVSAARVPRDSAPSDHPCGLMGERTVDPLVVAETGEMTVSAHYGYQCPTATRRVHYFVIIENSRELDRTGYSGRQMLPNLRDALTTFVDQVNYDDGSKGGLMLFSLRNDVRVDLSGDAGGKQQLISAIRSFPVGGSSSASAFGQAIQDATELLLADEHADEAMNAILFVQAGARVNNPPVDIETACKAAKDEGITIAGLALEGVEEPFFDCASDSWFRTAARENGEDLDRILESMGKSLVSGHQAASVEYCDAIAQDFAFVDGSASPRPPDGSALDTYCWEDLAPPAAEGYTVTYHVKPRRDVANDVVPMSLDTVIRLSFEDSTWSELDLDVPDVCVYKAGEQDFCDRFAVTLTPQAATPTNPPTSPPTMPPSATATTVAVTETQPAPTSETPEPTESATMEPAGSEIYLPHVLKRHSME